MILQRQTATHQHEGQERTILKDRRNSDRQDFIALSAESKALQFDLQGWQSDARNFPGSLP